MQWTIEPKPSGGATTLGGGTPDTGCGTPAFQLNLTTVE